MKTLYLSFLLGFLGALNGFSQSTETRIQTFLTENRTKLGLSESDVASWIVYDQHTDKRTGLTHAYIRQKHNDIEVYNAIAVYAITDEKVLMTGNHLISNLSKKAQNDSPNLTAEQAVIRVSELTEVENPIAPALLSRNESEFLFDRSNISIEPISVKLMWVPNNDSLQLAWDVSIYKLDANHWWSVRIDAHSGEELNRVDWVTHCSFGENHAHNEICSQTFANKEAMLPMMPPPPPATDQYNVFALPIESPNHGIRSLVVGPYDATASPFGWHDTDGVAGAESNLTFGNNVRAYEDAGNNNAPGYSPDGSASLDFDYALDMSQTASGYLDPAITNLFYMNNMMHDIWYQYGFDEASGNFQENNYGNGGAASDRVNAEAQDGSGMNNANFATPPDGSNPRMQMYLWDNPGQQLLTVNAPGSLAGGYVALPASFGSSLTSTPITSDLVIYNDSTPDNYDACENPVNTSAMNGNIVLIRRGTCAFVDKVQRAQAAGAIAVIMVNNVAGAPITMGGNGPGIGIPSVMISDIDGEAIIAEIEGGGTVNGTLVDVPVFDLDGDFDNGIIAHEYGHGISTRLTGGASNSNCLNNKEQMGEGWSDWFGLVLTMEPSDLATDNRGIGTFVTGESPNGVGIRPAPYNTDMLVNPYTYDATNNAASISEPHGIGFIWCTMLWDMTWDLIAMYGFDPNVHSGTGGNNIAMNLVIEGIKLQPCSPGFVDGRDAILQADQLLYGGIHECLIWNAFANRGLGYSADQGSTDNRGDQTEAFDLPPNLTNVSGSESISACGSYTWAANGLTYTSSGSYSETLTSVGGCDSTATLNLTIVPSVSSTDVQTACGSFTWIDGNTYTSSNNTATHVLTTNQGCDSLVTLDLTINQPSTGTDVITACGSYTWIDGMTYSANNNSATWLLSNAQGCDSVVTLDLTISNTTTSTDVITACNSYTWIDGVTYTSSNSTATYLLSNSTGCDSIVSLNLTINNTTSGTDYVTACDSYTWIDGTTYSSSNNTATYSVMNSAGCDSLVTLNLTIVTSSPVTTETVNACESYTWLINGTTYTISGQFTETLTNLNGCDSTVVLDLTINNGFSSTESVTSCDIYTWNVNGVIYSSSGSYSESFISSNGCDSMLTLDLTIENVDATADFIDDVTLGANMSVANFQWIDCNNSNAPISGATNQTFSPTSNGSFAVIVTSGSCSDTSECLTVSKIGINELKNTSDIIIYPNPTTGNISIDLGQNQEKVSTRLMNTLGQTIDEGLYLSTNFINLEINQPPGTYILEICINSDTQEHIKIIKSQ